jgi:hypothetical protein
LLEAHGRTISRRLAADINALRGRRQVSHESAKGGAETGFEPNQDRAGYDQLG